MFIQIPNMTLASSSFKRLLLAFILSIFMLQTNSQVLKDTVTLNLVKNAVDQIYDMRFKEAGISCNKINEKYPEHPVVFLLRGMMIYWEHYPLISGSSPGDNFEDQMYACIEKSRNFTQENEAEYLLSSLCARGSLLAFYAGNNLNSKVSSLGRSSYKYLRRSFEFTGIFPDFLFFTGLYNYYREAYPDAHPVYKPFFALFPRGNRENGMNQLRTAFRESIFLKAEAATFLSSNYKYFEDDFENASYFSRTIFREHQSNIVYRLNCIEDMLLTSRYDEAEKLIESQDPDGINSYFKAQLKILRGVLEEKKYGNMNKAQQEYSIGADEISQFGEYGKQFMAYAYFGLSRISAINNDRHSQRNYRRRALDLTDFENVSFD